MKKTYKTPHLHWVNIYQDSPLLSASDDVIIPVDPGNNEGDPDVKKEEFTSLWDEEW